MQLQSCNLKTMLRILTVHTLYSIFPHPQHTASKLQDHTKNTIPQIQNACKTAITESCKTITTTTTTTTGLNETTKTWRPDWAYFSSVTNCKVFMLDKALDSDLNGAHFTWALYSSNSSDVQFIRQQTCLSTAGFTLLFLQNCFALLWTGKFTWIKNRVPFVVPTWPVCAFSNLSMHECLGYLHVNVSFGFLSLQSRLLFLAVGNLGLIQMMMTRRKKDITLPDFNIKKTKHTTPGTVHGSTKERAPVLLE